MISYKLKHIPTGMYFTPSKGSGNLSKKGKMYDRMPKLEWVETLRIVMRSFNSEPSIINKKICDYFNIDYNKGRVDIYVKSNPADWLIVLFTITQDE